MGTDSDDNSSRDSGRVGNNSTTATTTMPRGGSMVCFDAMMEEVETAVAPHVGYKKVLVTGGAGFIGSHVAEVLLARGDDVVIVDEMNDYYDVRIKENNLRLLLEAYPDEGRLKIY